MTNLPQIHDWFSDLLTPGQWVFLWIVLGLIIWGLMIWIAVKESDGNFAGIGLVMALSVPPLVFFGVPLLIGHFISFMIWLWFGGVGG